MKKRMISLLLTAAMLVSLLTAMGASAGAVSSSGWWEDRDGVWYFINGDGYSHYYDDDDWYYDRYHDYKYRTRLDSYSADASFYYAAGKEYEMDLYVSAYGDVSGGSFRNDELSVDVDSDTEWAVVGVSSNDDEDADVTISRVLSSKRTTDSVNADSGRFWLDYGENVFRVTVTVDEEIEEPAPPPAPTAPADEDEDEDEDPVPPTPLANDLGVPGRPDQPGGPGNPNNPNQPGPSIPFYNRTETFYVVVDREEEEAPTYTITTTASVGGTASSSELTVEEGGSATIRFTPYTGYAVAMVLVDGENQGLLTTYTFKNVTEDHTVKVIFAQIEEAPVVPEYKMTFTDVSDSAWYYKYVYELCKAGIISGYPNNTFSPDGQVTWGEALKLVMLAAGYDEQAAPAGEYWATGYMNKAIALGILDKTVDLKAAIDRKAIAALAANALGLGSPKDASPFADTKLSAAVVLYEAGVITGSYNTSGNLVFMPDSSLTRAEFSAIIYRIYQLEK